jgi:FKBP-type peptidyl-prolyl cis-trans isomerase SlyD
MGGFQVGPETFVTLHYQVFDAEGEAATIPEVIAAVFGMGQLLGALERAIEGKSEGEKVDFTIPPTEAFGVRDPSRIVEIAREEFPPNVERGDRFEVENEQGGLLVVHVLEVSDDLVVIDTNHPLADQEARFVVEIREVRPATEDELQAASELMEEDSAYLAAEAPHVGMGQLLRRSN